MPNNRIGDQTLVFHSKPMIISSWTVVGHSEGAGPDGKYFDTILNDDSMGEVTAEKSERRYLETAIEGALSKAKMKSEDIDIFVGGDLLNQIITATFNARKFQMPYLGLYNACATFGEGLIVGSMIIDGEYADAVLVGVASNYQTAERQYRFPIELNLQRKDTNQMTVCGSGACILGKLGNGPRIAYATVGRVVDMGEKDTNDMGSAMAPSAADTLAQHFKDLGTTPGDYDFIFTGDLATYGSKVFRDLVKESTGYSLGNKYDDGGCRVFGPEASAKAGASGCGCSATVVLGYILKKMAEGEMKRVLVMPTGALHSPLSTQQGETIPCITHAIVLEC